jgi:signal-transduction protein with cAMP-binding, CBS, and nucleotidyltransferase domain
MAFVTNNPGNIMTSRAAKTLLDDIHKRLAARMAEMESRDYLALMHRFREELVQEENVDTWIAAEFASLRDRLAATRLVDELGPLYVRLIELATRHFQARSSVSTFHEFSGLALETLLETALTIARELLRQEGQEPAGACWALLASDGLGRHEATRKGHNAIILIHDDGPDGVREHFHRLALQLMTILGECAMPPHLGLHRNHLAFWHGSLDDWRGQIRDAAGAPVEQTTADAAVGSAQGEQYARAIELVADLRPLCGDVALATRATEMADAILAWERQREPFRQFARRVATMPVALGIFGRFRTAMTGKHRGEFSLEEMATRPLVASVRLLAIAAGIRETSTQERIKALLAGGSLGVALADRLLVALHDFVRCQVELEIATQVDDGDYFFNPDVLTDGARERFKAGLEDLTTLQRLVYQQLVEVE